MVVFELMNGEIKKHDLLIEALKIDVDKRQVISFVGGGGKTSLIYKLGEELSKLEKKVIVTTTTHMFIPQNNVVLTGRESDIVKLLKHENLITVGINASEKNLKSDGICKSKKETIEKMSGLDQDMTKRLIEFSDFVLVEADGSKRLPLKVPDKHEPVILGGSSLVIGVCGIDALGKSIKEICHRSRLVAELLNTDENHIINPMDIANILSNPKGTRKNVTGLYKVIINKADTVEQLQKAKNISRELFKFGINEAIITTFKDSEN